MESNGKSPFISLRPDPKHFHKLTQNGYINTVYYDGEVEGRRVCVWSYIVKFMHFYTVQIMWAYDGSRDFHQTEAVNVSDFKTAFHRQWTDLRKQWNKCAGRVVAAEFSSTRDVDMEIG